MKTSFVERAKSFILCILILSSIIMTYRLWFDNHNLFDILGVLNPKGAKENNVNSLEYVYFPTKILFNEEEKSHRLITSTDTHYRPLQIEGSQIVRAVLSSTISDELDISHWNELMSKTSMLFGYEIYLDSNLLSKLLNFQKAQNGIQSIKEFIVIQDNTVSQNLKCYVKDDNHKKIYMVKFSYNDATFKSIINQIVSNSDTHNYVTAFEMKYDLLKDDILLLPIEDVMNGRIISLANEFNLQSDNDVTEKIKYFFEKYYIVKSIEYMNDSKTKLIKKEFIDRNNILKLYDDGRIEYSTAKIANNSLSVEMHSALQTAIDFVESNFGFPKDSYISEIKTLSDSQYIFCFDYLIDGLKVKLSSDDSIKHAIEIEVKGNTISSYKRYVKNYNFGNKQELRVSNINAIDKAVSRYRKKADAKENISISNVELVYVSSKYSNYSYPYWLIIIDGGNYYINSINEEI